MTSRFARLLVSAGFAVLVALGAVAGPAGPAAAQLPPPSDNTFGGERVHWLLNAERQARGLQPVQRHGAADLIAQWSANVQAWFGTLGHNPNLAHDVSKVVTPRWWFVGENIGCGASADHLHHLWLHSPPHAHNMLHGGVDTVGVGYTWARGCAWSTVVFIDT